MSMVMDGRLTVSGNWQLINELQQLFSQLYIDWPHVIVSGLGPVLGGQVVRTLIASQSWSKQVSRNFCVNLTNYLTEESRLLLTEEESHGFYQQVDQLALATDRLTARLAQLTQRLNVSA
jgi:ubiquinone biosynthesis protein UbiJ